MARNGTIFLNQAEIQAILDACAEVQADENIIYRLLTNGKCKDDRLILQQHIKYNRGLVRVQQLSRKNMGKAVLPSMIVETIESGGPRFIQLDPKIINSLQWTSSGFFEFDRLRNETISLWNSINSNIIHATVEEIEDGINESVLE